MFFNKKYKIKIEKLNDELEKLRDEKNELLSKNDEIQKQFNYIKEENESLKREKEFYESSRNQAAAADYSGVTAELDSLLGKLVSQDEWVIENINLINDIGLNVKDIAKNAGNTMDDMTQTTKDTSSIINGFTESFEELLNRVKSIENISSQINGIASQTQLLSLNASIESARAGEAGRGFTVVAEEIKKLSENTSRLLKDIQNTVRETYNIAVKAKEQAVSLNQGKSDSLLVANGAKEGFDKVAQKIEEITEKIQDIKQAGDRHLKLSQNIISKVNSIV